MVKYLRGRSISDWRAVFLRKGTLSLILAGIIAFQGVFLCSCKRSDTGYTKTIGTYDGKPIEWIYISHGEHTSILISKYILDVKPYDTSGTAVNWDSSSIRKWLNEDFYNQALPMLSEMRGSIIRITITETKFSCFRHIRRRSVSIPIMPALPSLRKTQKTSSLLPMIKRNGAGGSLLRAIHAFPHLWTS